MRRIETTTAFRRDFKREKAGRHGKVLDKKPDAEVLQLVRLGSHSALFG